MEKLKHEKTSCSSLLPDRNEASSDNNSTHVSAAGVGETVGDSRRRGGVLLFNLKKLY